MWSTALRWIEDAVAPRRCAFCGVHLTPAESPVCAGCHDDLPWAERPSAADIIYPNPFTTIIAPLEYAFPVDAAIKAFKFHRRFHYQPAFADILLRAAAQLPDDIDAVLPVPLHRWRRLARRFNQAEELATPLQKSLSVAVIRNVQRVSHTSYQSGLDAVERRRNLQSAFRARGVIQAQHVLIVDDVITTGETCRQLARVLFRCGVNKVSVLALARASSTQSG